MVKFSCLEVSRIPETEILDAIKKDAGHCPNIIDHVLHYTATKSTTYSTSHIRGRPKLNTEGTRLSCLRSWRGAFQI